MQKYFKYDYEESKESNDTLIFLKQIYDKTDDIFEERFEKQNKSHDNDSVSKSEKNQKSNELKELISEVKRRVPKDDVKNTKMVSLVLGNAYLRLAQCQHEIFEKPKSFYQKANYYLEGYVGYSIQDEIDLLMTLNKGKYFRNTAEVGKKSDYTRAYNIFSTVEKQIRNIDITNEKGLHLLLDAVINMGRVSRYGYNFDQARNIFLSIIRALEKYIDNDVKKEVYHLDILKASLINSSANENIEWYLHRVNEELIHDFLFEYLLQALIHIGIIYRKEKNYDNAIKIFELIEKIDTRGSEKNIDALNNLGVCYRKLGDHKGRNTAIGIEMYGQAKKIFEDLSAKGNRFASINLYKCQLIHDSPETDEIIEKLKKEVGLENSFHLQFILGRFYEKRENYEDAIKIFENIVCKRFYIARGSIGFKVYYNLAQCKIRQQRFREALKVLSHIRNMLKKNQAYKDVMTEIDYGWCLMKEGNYKQAIQVYKDFQKEDKISISPKYRARIINNLADCYIHLQEWDKAKECIDKVLDKTETDIMAKYLKGILLLNQTILSQTSDFNKIYQIFEELTDKKSSELGINSSWLISALLSYNASYDKELKEKIIRVITCSSDSFSLKSYFYLAQFILDLIEKESDDEVVSSICRNFCHIKLNKHGENQAFQFLMNNIDFHSLPRKDRAFILAHLVLMYKTILNIKNSCLFTHEDLSTSKSLPYHYTKLSTLKCLLADQESKKPRLRLWNSIYMNDAYEGKIFDKLLLYSVQSGKEDLLKAYTDVALTSPIQADSNVYITSFSTATDSFQMWSIYGDNEQGAAIKFGEDFFDIKDNYYDSVLDSRIGKYSLYKVKYIDTSVFQKTEKMENFRNICTHICIIEERLKLLQQQGGALKSVAEEIRSFIVDRLNEVRFLFKSPSYEYEHELRLVQCSHKPKIDNQNFAIPRLYIDVEKEIKNLTVKLGSKLENRQIKELSVWLKNTGKVKDIEISDLSKTI